MDVDADKLDFLTAVQTEIADKINSDVWAVNHGVNCYPENIGDIQFKVDSAIDKLGLCVIIATPTLSYQGANADGLVWGIDSLNIVASEIPSTNRARANYATALSAAVRIAKVLKASGCIPVSIAQTEINGVTIVTVTMKARYQFTDAD